MDKALPLVSFVVVNDFPGEGWGTELTCFRALAAQDYAGPVEVLLAMPAGGPEPPPELVSMVPSLRVVWSEERSSSAMKNEATSLATGEFVALVDADSWPRPNWLATLVGALLEHPEAAVASGRITYGSETMAQRVLGVLHRGYIERRAGPGAHFADNGSVFRREVALRIPYPPERNPFVGPWLRNTQLLEAGETLWFEPAAEILHELPGWRFVLDAHRNTGYSDMRMAPGGPRWTAIPRLYAWRVRYSWHTLARVGDRYLRWYDYPAAIAAMVFLRLADIPGMVDAVRGLDEPGGTRYR